MTNSLILELRNNLDEISSIVQEKIAKNIKQNQNNTNSLELVLSIDYGSKKTGIAVSNSEVSQGVLIGNFATADSLYSKISNLTQEHNCFVVIVGYPYPKANHRINGKESKFIKELEDFITTLEDKINKKNEEVLVVIIDESNSSKKVKNHFDIKKQNKNMLKTYDQYVALFLLESFIKQVNISGYRDGVK